MKRLATAIWLALAVVACGPGPAASTPSGSSGPASDASPGQAASTAAARSAAPGTARTAQVYFTSGAKVVAEAASIRGENPPAEALGALLKGPKQPNHYTEIPGSVRMEQLTVKDGTAAVSFDASFFSSAGSTGIQLRLAQVVFTLTQFPDITAVQFLEDGKPATVAGGEGFPLNRPLTRGSFSSLAS